MSSPRKRGSCTELEVILAQVGTLHRADDPRSRKARQRLSGTEVLGRPSPALPAPRSRHKIPDNRYAVSGMTTGPISGIRRKWGLLSVQLDLNVDTGCQVELHQRIDCLVGRIDDIHQTLVRPDFVLVARILVHVR